MKKWRKYFALLFLFVCIIGLAGCARMRTIDKISIIHVFGFDRAENGELIGTALIPEYTKDKSGSQIQYLGERAPTSSLVVSKLATHTSTPIELAKVRVLLIGKDLAETGIQDLVEWFIITPQVGTNIHIAVSTQAARETLNAFRKEKSLTLYERIEHNMLLQSLPTMNLHVFLNYFYGEGMDAYVPMLSLDEKGDIKINGVGIFKDDKFKLHLKLEQSALLSILKDYRSQAILKIDHDGHGLGEAIVVRAFRSKSNWDWDQKKEQLNLRLKLEWTLVQHPERFDLEKEEDLLEIKKLIVEKLEKGIGDLLTTFKENEVDPVGIGNIVRSQDKTWKKEAFYKKYPTLPINVNVNLDIIHSGLER